jgi:hypothetical protein
LPSSHFNIERVITLLIDIDLKMSNQADTCYLAAVDGSAYCPIYISDEEPGHNQGQRGQQYPRNNQYNASPHGDPAPSQQDNPHSQQGGNYQTTRQYNNTITASSNSRKES